MSHPIPYVVGQWVRGESFYGRASLLERALGQGRASWIVGMRRIGKTSLLKELERAAPGRGLLPVFWDLQGADDGQELALSFDDAVLDAEPRLARHGLPVPAPGRGLEQALGELLEGAARAGASLLLLLDEGEELITLSRAEPAIVDRLGRLLGEAPGCRLVLVSALGLARRGPHMEGAARLLSLFPQPCLLGPLTPATARQLVQQTQLPAVARPSIEPPVAAAIVERCGGHPFLLQIVAKRFAESGDLEGACQQVMGDPMVHAFMAVDFRMLDRSQQGLLRGLGRGGSMQRDAGCRLLDGDSAGAAVSLDRLAQLGLVREAGGGQLEAGNLFLGDWMSRCAG
jgi:hypothetical protein